MDPMHFSVHNLRQNYRQSTAEFCTLAKGEEFESGIKIPDLCHQKHKITTLDVLLAKGIMIIANSVGDFYRNLHFDE